MKELYKGSVSLQYMHCGFTNTSFCANCKFKKAYAYFLDKTTLGWDSPNSTTTVSLFPEFYWKNCHQRIRKQNFNVGESHSWDVDAFSVCSIQTNRLKLSLILSYQLFSTFNIFSPIKTWIDLIFIVIITIQPLKGFVTKIERIFSLDMYSDNIIVCFNSHGDQPFKMTFFAHAQNPLWDCYGKYISRYAHIFIGKF